MPETLEQLQNDQPAIEIQATTSTDQHEHGWHATIITYAHNEPELRSVGSITGRGEAHAPDFNAAISHAVQNWRAS